MITLEEFNKKHGLNDSHVHVKIHEGSLSRSVLKGRPRKRGGLLIDENYFLRRIEFRNKVKNYIQDMYFLLTEVASDLKLGRVFGIPNTYFGQGLWHRYDGTILNCKINGTDWKLFRKMRKLHRKIERLGVKFNISEILDAEINGAYSWEEYKKIKQELNFHQLVNIVQRENMLAS